jgi:hypothetical protein
MRSDKPDTAIHQATENQAAENQAAENQAAENQAAAAAYEVGYGRPPKANRFQPGRSGNPRGRPKGARSLLHLIDRELDSRVRVSAEGVTRAMPKRDIIARQWVDKAVRGDAKALQAVMRAQNELDINRERLQGPRSPSGPPTPDIEPSLPPEDIEELANRWAETMQAATKREDG